ncbi:hypothetical protein TeGR_g1522, partial [Tetraparma gracilis]
MSARQLRALREAELAASLAAASPDGASEASESSEEEEEPARPAKGFADLLGSSSEEEDSDEEASSAASSGSSGARPPPAPLAAPAAPPPAPPPSPPPSLDSLLSQFSAEDAAAPPTRASPVYSCPADLPAYQALVLGSFRPEFSTTVRGGRYYAAAPPERKGAYCGYRRRVNYEFALEHQFGDYPAAPPPLKTEPTVSSPAAALPASRTGLVRPAPSSLPSFCPPASYSSPPDPSYASFLPLVHGDPLFLFRHLSYSPFHLPSLLDALAVVSKFPLSRDPLPGSPHSALVSLLLRLVLAFELAPPAPPPDNPVPALPIYAGALSSLLTHALKTFPPSHAYPYYLLRRSLPLLHAGSLPTAAPLLWLCHSLSCRSVGPGADLWLLEYLHAFHSLPGSPAPPPLAATAALCAWRVAERRRRAALGLEKGAPDLTHPCAEAPGPLLLAAAARFPALLGAVLPGARRWLPEREVGVGETAAVFQRLCGAAWEGTAFGRWCEGELERAAGEPRALPADEPAGVLREYAGVRLAAFDLAKVEQPVVQDEDCPFGEGEGLDWMRRACGKVDPRYVRGEDAEKRQFLGWMKRSLKEAGRERKRGEDARREAADAVRDALGGLGGAGGADVDLDDPAVQVLLRSFLPWARVDAA